MTTGLIVGNEDALGKIPHVCTHSLLSFPHAQYQMSESSEFRALWSFTQVNGFISNRAKTYGTYKGCLFSLQQLLTISRCTMALQLSVWHNGEKKATEKHREAYVTQLNICNTIYEGRIFILEISP